MTDGDPNGSDCGGCDLGRRSFLLNGAIAAAALAGLGADAYALPVRWVRAIAERRQEVTYPIPAADGVSIDKDTEVILARSGHSLYAFMLSCPHQNTALKWFASDNRFQCPRHKSLYSADGTFIEGRATRSMDRFAVHRAGGHVVVNLDKVFEEDQDAAGWKGAFLTV
jgi:nitrite reductase/ring-hydroxylating ferredoxin subunit